MVRIGNVDLEDCVLNIVAEVNGIVGPAGRDANDAVKRLTDYLTAGLVGCEEEKLNEMLYELYEWDFERNL